RGQAVQRPSGREDQAAVSSGTPEQNALAQYGSSSSASDSDSCDDGPPEAVSSKAPPAHLSSAEEVTTRPEGAPEVGQTADDSKNAGVEGSAPKVQSRVETLEPKRKPLPVQPKRPPRNPFASRPTLLRNLLLPEIRMTVANLSQAIHFLVDNDFLEDVELKPGEADEKMIEVIVETSTNETIQHDKTAQPTEDPSEPLNNMPSLS
ncbi:hypothetical protein EVG20_g9396, partial [Dentipellis fragilis]